MCKGEEGVQVQVRCVRVRGKGPSQVCKGEEGVEVQQVCKGEGKG